ncbi:MAG: hypothetical protein AAGI37_06805 [Planctomycetota bacterium]
MSIPALKPESKDRCYVAVTDPKTRKSRSFTLYGVTPAQAVELLKRGVELVQAEQAKEVSAA